MTLSAAERLTAAGHAALPWANPLDAEGWERLLARTAAELGDGGGRRGLDIGCGPGLLAHRLSERLPGLHLRGIDRNPRFIERAQALPALPRLRFECLDAAALDPDERFDLLLCVGASQAFGTPREALASCQRLLRPGGLLLWADIEWAAEPPQALLDFLDCPRELYWPRGALPEQGWQALHEEVASAAAWQHYESTVGGARRAEAERLDDSESRAQWRLRQRAWDAAWDADGRHCFGFHAHLLRALP
ncbi:MAG: class I SAM-dependent methyltransferase [Burkholderiales bacterium]|nr:class I SAM-dependent methyltransferase [Burkholderiales bacterium]